MASKIEMHVNMTCGNCVEKINKKLGSSKDIEHFEVSLEEGTVTVETTLPSSDVISLIESTGKKAIIKGFGEHSAAVAIIEVGNVNIKGVIRFTQVSKESCIIDGTIDGLNSGSYLMNIHECGDISDGCNSVGDIYSPNDILSNSDKITADDTGRSKFRIIQQPMILSDLIGRSAVIKQENGHRLACGIIARSAGLFANPKKICACDGVTLWDEKNKPVSSP